MTNFLHQCEFGVEIDFGTPEDVEVETTVGVDQTQGSLRYDYLNLKIEIFEYFIPRK